MKIKITVLFLIVAAISLSVFVTFSLIVDNTRYRNDFVRIFPSHAADFSGSIRLSDGILSITGVTNQSLYLRTGEKLIELSTDLLDKCQISIDGSEGYDLTIDSPYFYLQSGSRASVKRGSTLTWRVDTTYSLPGFIAMQPISKNSFVLQVVDMKARKTVFTSSAAPNSQKDILKKQVDGIFCTDGLLGYSSKLNILVYTYRYRNQFLCFDTSLNILRTANTIDTTTTARIAVSEVDGKITMSKPPFLVNKGTCVDGANLFVNSNLVARNELADEAIDRSVIDVYNILDGSYRYSFYVPDQENVKMRSFRVQGNALFAVFQNTVIRYDLASDYLKN